MRVWNQTPVLRFLPFFIAGMFCGFYFQISPVLLFICSLFVFGLFVFQLIRIHKKYTFLAVRFFGLLAYLFVFLCSWGFTLLKTEKEYPFHFSKQKNCDAYLAVICEDPKDKGNSYRFEAKILQIKKDSSWCYAEGRVLVYMRKNSLVKIPGYGDSFLFTKQPEELKDPLNPEQFDFRKWLSTRQIYHQLALKNDEFVLTRKHQAFALVEWSIALRNQWIRVFKENGVEGQEFAVLSALILGYDDEISSETMQAYAASGALHILSVSGMHLGIIYGALQTLLAFLSKHKRSRLFKAILIILFLWFYALLTGLSPSVLRSAMMLTFIVIGQTLARSTNTYNTLGASMLALFILFSPQLILQAGFQLSYLAVAGILFLYKEIEAKLYFKSWFGKQVWGILSVSLAAQMATFPLSLYYFHQFPNYFLPSNLVVIPISTAVIFGGIILLLLSSWAWLALKVAWITGKLVLALNTAVSVVEQLPYSMLSGIYVSFAELLIWYFAVVFFAIYFTTANKKWFMLAVPGIIFLFCSVCFRHLTLREQQKLIVYQIPKSFCVQFIQGNSSVVLTDSSGYANPRMRKMASAAFEIKSGIRDENTKVLDCNQKNPEIFLSKQMIVSGNSIQFGTTRIDLFNSMKTEFAVVSNAEFLLVSQNTKPPKNFKCRFPKCKKVIVDGSNSRYTIVRWEEFCKQERIAFHSTSSQGAFILETSESANLR